MTPTHKLEIEETSRPISRDPTEMLNTDDPELPGDGDGAGACSLAPLGEEAPGVVGAGEDPEGRFETNKHNVL